MGNRREYLEFLLDWLSPLGLITARAMMGGHVLYCDGIVFALVADNTFYLKTDGQTRPGFEALGLEPFHPFPDKPAVMPYCQPPADFFDNAGVMSEWGRAAVAVGARAAAGKPARKKPAARRR